jgi:hypothetical protein
VWEERSIAVSIRALSQFQRLELREKEREREERKRREKRKKIHERFRSPAGDPAPAASSWLVFFTKTTAPLRQAADSKSDQCLNHTAPRKPTPASIKTDLASLFS